jgi:hypothetical protein
MTTSPQNTIPGKNPKKSPATRTTLITAVAVAGVILAGTAAVAANIGILNAADSSVIGDLAATDQLVAVAPTASTTPTTSTTSSVVTTAPSNPDGTTEYAVDDAGTVKLATGPGGLILAEVSANSGWTSAATQSGSTSLTVSFTDGARTVIFTATLSADGSIAADVTEPIVVSGTASPSAPTAQAPPATATGGYDDDDDDDDDRYEDEEREYEGADDDD